MIINTHTNILWKKITSYKIITCCRCCIFHMMKGEICASIFLLRLYRDTSLNKQLSQYFHHSAAQTIESWNYYTDSTMTFIPMCLNLMLYLIYLKLAILQFCNRASAEWCHEQWYIGPMIELCISYKTDWQFKWCSWSPPEVTISTWFCKK